MIKAIIFDCGGVLIDLPTQQMYSYCAKHLRVSKKDIIKAHKRFENDFQKGLITENKIWEKICKKLKVQKPTTKSLWIDAFKQAYSPRKEMFSLVTNLHNNGYKTGLLSNTEIPVMKFFRKQSYDMFDVAVFSCAEGTSKPEKKIYEITLKKLIVKPQEAIFIDDKKDFIKGAKQVGINTILFKNPKQVKEEIKKLIKI